MVAGRTEGTPECAKTMPRPPSTQKASARLERLTTETSRKIDVEMETRSGRLCLGIIEPFGQLSVTSKAGPGTK
jgi:hypothetical protein